MTHIGPSLPAAERPTADAEARLRAAVKQLEGVFVEQLFKAMRETVPQDGLTNGGAGEQIFAGLLDQRVAATAPEQWEHGIGEALYRQLRAALPAAPSAPMSTNADEKRTS
jgi:flagellar protein FlgJ